MLKPYKTLKKDVLFENKFVKVIHDRIEAGNGKEGTYTYETRGDGVFVIGEDLEENFLLVKEYKHPAKDFVINAAAGSINSGEAVEVAARRELLEETGYKSDANLVSLGTIYVAPSRTPDVINFFYLPECVKVTK